MRRSRLIIAVVLAVVGLAWLGQGLDLVKGSAMSGSNVWTIVGLVLLVLAGLILVNERRRPSTSA
jgi:LPXTG-motif cell wall-anchored protein